MPKAMIPIKKQTARCESMPSVFRLSDMLQFRSGPFHILRTDRDIVRPAVDLSVGAKVPVVQLRAAAADRGLRLVKAGLHDLDTGGLQLFLAGLPAGLVSPDPERDLPFSKQRYARSLPAAGLRSIRRFYGRMI